MHKLLELLARITLCSALVTTAALCDADTSKQNSDPTLPSQPKDWNWMVYMCNNNNLHRFGIQNFKEMVKAGSTPTLNILLQMDDIGATSIKRFYIQQGNPTIIEEQSNTNSSYSGTPQNLFEFAQWGIKRYPSNRTCLVLWNHGSGIKDPSIWDRMLMRWRDDLFVFNYKTGLLELNRSFKHKKDFFDALKAISQEKGIAFNDAAEAYLTNDDLKKSLRKISTELLDGKKLDILAMDACHMAMVEIASEVKDSVKIITASEEVEPGAGYDYELLKSFATHSFDEITLAGHIVWSYQDRYKGINGDYTQSAIDLTCINELESHMTELALSLTGLLSQGDQDTIKAIRKIRFNYSLSTEFLDSDYIDLNHLFKSLALVGSAYAKNQENPELTMLWGKTSSVASNGIATLKKMIIANVAGVNLPDASGLAIYFPTSMIHSSYYKTEFAKITGWVQFLEKFIRTKKGNASGTVPVRDIPVKACCDDCAQGKECADEQRGIQEHKKNKKKKMITRCIPCSQRRKKQQDGPKPPVIHKQIKQLQKKTAKKAKR